MPAVASPSTRSTARVALLAVVLVVAAGLPRALEVAGAPLAPDHLVISEVVTGGASASDELIELHNPTDGELPLEGLELVYVSASGTTVTRRATWPAGAPAIPARGHYLLANDAGAFAAIADALVTGGMAATGGSVALRIQGATTAIDAVGWGTASSAWMEGTPAVAPAPGESLERLPGGAAGSTIDTDDNASDFAVRPVPDPQNLGSEPTPLPGTTPPPPTPMPTTGPTAAPPTLAPPTPTPTPGGPDVLTIAAARALPDGSEVRVEGVTLAGSDFTDGGGYLADATAGIAVLPDADPFVRGRLVRVTGEIDDRFGQRTIRVAAGGVEDLGPTIEPVPALTATGSLGEATEGRLVRVVATIARSASVLSSGVAYDIDDGSGPTRLVIGAGTGIDTSAWRSGTRLDLVGVAGQRDSSGTGTTGYRLHPRDPADVVDVAASPSAAPSATTGASPTPVASGSPTPGVVSVAEARNAPKNARVRVVGVVTLPTGVVDAETAAIQDASGAILLRLGDEAGALRLGERVEVSGTRSTKSGMETLRVPEPPRRVGSGADPEAPLVRTGEVGESLEARLATVRGGLVASARRASSGTVSFEIDDGSGPLRIVVGGTLGLDRAPLVAGAWVEVRGVVGQETTGSQPTRGYRIWPRATTEVELIAAVADDESSAGGTGSGSGGAAATASGLDEVGVADATIGATLVAGPWPELGVGGLLWDGERLVAIIPEDAARVRSAIARRAPPVPLELRGLSPAGPVGPLGLAAVTLDEGPGAVVPGGGVHAPTVDRPPSGSGPAWVSMLGRLIGAPDRPRLETSAGTVAIDVRCAGAPNPPRGAVAIVGIAFAGSAPLVVPCTGIVAAPVLALGAVGDVAVVGPDARSPRSSGPAPDADGLVPVAAGLLGAASVTLAGVAAWARSRREETPTDPDREGSSAADPVEEPAMPVLTLVSAPHERGP